MKMFVFMNPDAKIDEVKAACAKAEKEGYDSICVPQWLVSTAADALTATKVAVVTLIGLPGGTTSSFAKFAEAKQAVANGANKIIIPVNMQMCVNGNLDGAKSDLSAALVAGKTILANKNGVEIAALVDGAELGDEQLKAVAKMCVAANVSEVMIAHSDALELAKEIPAVVAF